VVKLVSAKYIHSKKLKTMKGLNPTQLCSWILSFPFVHLFYNCYHRVCWIKVW